MRFRILAIVAAALGSLPGFCHAQLPNPALDYVFPAGGQTGTSVVVNVVGRDLDGAERLLFSHPGLQGVPVLRPAGEFETGEQVVINQFRVDIPANLPVGAYDVRVVGRFGASTPRTFLVGSVPELLEAADNHQPAQAQPLPLDQVVHGRADAGVIDYYQVHAEAGQTLVVECLAQQIDSQLLPVVTVWDGNKKQLRRSRLLMDPALPFVVPATGDYLVGVHDHVYGGGATHAYRLRVYASPYLVAADPIVAEAGGTRQLQLLGFNLAGGEPTEMRMEGLPLQRQTLSLFLPPAGPADPPQVIEPVTAEATGYVVRVPGPAGYSNGLLIPYAQYAVVAEQAANDHPDLAQPVTVPVEIGGRFFPRRDQDWVQFSATQGQAFQVRAISHQLGHPTDPEIFVQRVVRQADGTVQVSQVSTDDDYRTARDRLRLPLRRALSLTHRDATVRFTADQTAEYRVGMRDLNGSSTDDPRLTYRLIIEPVTPDFRLLAWAQQQATDDDKKIDRAALVLRRGESLPVLVDVLRTGGFQGPVQLSATQLPSGVTAEPCIVAEGEMEGVLVLTADDSVSFSTGPITIVGAAQINGSAVQREAYEAILTGATGNIEQSAPPARLARQMILSVIPQDQTPAQIRLASGSTDSALPVVATSVGGKLSIPLHLTAIGELKSELPLAIFGLPDKVKMQGPTLKADALDGQAELTLDAADIKPGRYTLFARGALKTAFARNAAAIAAAQQRRTEFDAVLQALTAELQVATEAVTHAKQQVADQAERLARWENQQQAADQALAAAADQVRQASEALQSLAADGGTLPSEIADSVSSRMRQVLEFSATMAQQTADARGQLAAARDQLNEARTRLQQQQQEVATAETRQQEQTAKLARAQEFVKQLDQQLADAQKNYGPADASLYVHSPAFALQIDPTPLGIAAPAEPIRVMAGRETLISIPLERRYGFADSVTVSAELPGGLQDVQVEAVTAAADQADAVLTVRAGNGATIGQHAVKLRFNLKFNGVDLVDFRAITLDVQAP